MRNHITAIRHRTKVCYSYVDLNTSMSSTETVYLDNWLSNETFIKNKLKTEGKHIYRINSIEQVSTSYKMRISQFFEMSVPVIETEKIHKVILNQKEEKE